MSANSANLDSQPNRSHVRQLIALVRTWRQRLRDRRELALMGERSLRELGLTRYDALQEIRKPFWRA